MWPLSSAVQQMNVVESGGLRLILHCQCPNSEQGDLLAMFKVEENCVQRQRFADGPHQTLSWGPGRCLQSAWRMQWVWVGS